jgi:hypothetical protein
LLDTSKRRAGTGWVVVRRVDSFDHVGGGHSSLLVDRRDVGG